MYRSVCEVVAYTADADVWCPECAALVYDRRDDSGILRTILAGNAIDSEGNDVYPIFFGDDDFLDTYRNCNRCGEEFDI